MALENLTPLTREEKYLSKIAGEETTPPEPLTREEQYLAKIAGADTVVPEPETRREYYLNKIAESGEGGGGEGDFTIAKVTFSAPNDNVSVHAPFLYTGVGVKRSTPTYGISGNLSLDVILYKGCAELRPENADIQAVSGQITKSGNTAFIKGDGTITLTLRVPD